MKKIGLLLGLLTAPVFAGTMGNVADLASSKAWYAAIGTGYSWTSLPGINNPNPNQWDASIEGYNAPLGDRGFYTFEIGKQVHPYIDVSLLYMDSETFNYQMYQQGSSSTSGFTGNARTRYFDVTNRTVLINGFIHPDNALWTSHDMNVNPFIGGGIGYSLSQVTNFQTVGTFALNGVPFGSTSSIGNDVNTSSFSWQLSAGLALKPEKSPVSIDVGYRYYNSGSFYTASQLYSNTIGWVSATPWSGKVIANQFFIDFRYTI